MEVSHREILIHLRSEIIDDIDVDNDIVQPLRNEYILREDDVKTIYVGATKEERAGILLDILPQCGPNAFDVFHQSLKHHYDWLSNAIDKLLGNCKIETNGEIDYYAGPSIPPHSALTVTREEKVEQLKVALQRLNPAEYIALHGMKGFGKSCLVASTLKDMKLVKDLFSNQVYWIQFSCNRSIEEEILIQLNSLYHNVRNLEIQPESFTPFERESLIQYLKHYFNKRDNCNALLILDDVHDEQIINTFEFKCKTLVLTADVDVLRKKRPQIIQLNDGFTEAETLGLFAKALNTDVNALPLEAKRIHEECKGMPLLIAMFAAQFEEFKEDMKIRPDRWRYYLRSLRNRDATNEVMRIFLEKQETIFDICIGQLKPVLKQHYESLVIFCEDVNINPKTLEIFWGQDIFKVEEMMLDLCHKSLAAKKWNKDLESYIYGVHDLLLCHLRKRRTRDDLMQMHESIIDKYREYCNDDFSKLPDDNYIYLYIGYHLEQANLIDEFPRLYLNFDFVQAKLIYAGLNDLLLDLRKYRQHITLGYTQDYVKKVDALERFLHEQASVIVEHKRKKCLDIIQIAMDYPHQDYVARTANNLAMTRREYLYLSHNKSLQYAKALTEEISTDNICTASFTDDPELILAGNRSGEILLLNSRTKQQKVFKQSRSKEYPIVKVIVSSDGDCFLSLNSAGIIKLFHLFTEDEMRNQDLDEMPVDSPRQKQKFWSNLLANSNNQDDSLATFQVGDETILDMAFGHEDKYIAACTNKATIQIWDRDGNTIFVDRNSKCQYIPKIAFTAGAHSLLHIMDEPNGAFVLYKKENDCNTYEYLACYNLQLKSACEKVIFFHYIPNRENSLMVVTKKEAMYVKWWWSQGCVHSFNKQTRAFVDKDSVTYECATITYDGEYIILADSEGYINVWNTYSGYAPIAVYKSRVKSLDSYWLRDEDYHIICGNDDTALYKWKLPVQESDKLPRKCLFDAIVSSDTTDIVIKESPSKKIIMSRGEDIQEYEYTEGKILNLQLSADGTMAVYVTDNQTIWLLDINTGTVTFVAVSDTPIQFVKIINLIECNRIFWQENILKMWQPSGRSIEIPTDSVNDIHIINKFAVIVTQGGIITTWATAINRKWRQLNERNMSDTLSYVTFSCLTTYKQKTYLAILNKSHCLTLFHINEEGNSINIQFCFTYSFAQKTTCCDISKNTDYIAVGFESGQISIIDRQKQMEVTQLSFHASPITQLYWAPIEIIVPILFSLTSDELALWNVALAMNNTKKTQKNVRRSRMGISHSTSTPSFEMNTLSNLCVPNSRSVDAGVSDLQDDNCNLRHVNNISRYWKKKIGKNPEIPELLAVVELPPNREPKVCISPDFSKFVIVDMYGSVNTFKLIDYNQFS